MENQYLKSCLKIKVGMTHKLWV